MTTRAIDHASILAAPKSLLHDHLDGGLRPATILELADEIGWTPNLPSTDLVEMQAWFTRGAETKDLLQYLATFEHTLAVMQTAEHIERVAYEAAIDLATDGVVYAEVRFAPSSTSSRVCRWRPWSKRCAPVSSAASARPEPSATRCSSTPSCARCAPSSGRWRSPS